LGTNVVVDAARQALGPVGVCLPVSFTASVVVNQQRDAVRRLEAAGYGAAWTNETVGGKDALVQLALLLAATDRMSFGTSIANIWARAPQTAHGAAALLAQAYPGRLVLGLGVGYPEQAASVGRDFGRPLRTMRDYLEQMGAPTQPPAPDAAYPRVVGANGPKMTALAAELADGAIPAMRPVEFTVQARQLLGPDKLLITGVRIFADDGRDPAVAAAADVRAHLAAGADHVPLLPPIGIDFATCVDDLERLAPELTAGTAR